MADISIRLVPVAEELKKYFPSIIVFLCNNSVERTNILAVEYYEMIILGRFSWHHSCHSYQTI
jgi:hypothetical protein